jgi:hypothetical protein
MSRYLEDDDYFRADAAYDVKTGVSRAPVSRTDSAASVDERTRLRKIGIPDVDPLAALQKSTTGIKPIDPDLVRDPKTGLSPAQVAANKAVAEAAAAQGLEVTPGAEGFTDRVSKIPVKVIDPNANFPKAGTILRYRASRTGFRIPIFADGKGGEYEGPEQADPDYDPNKDKTGGPQFVEFEYTKDFKKRRAKYFNSATGTFTYGEWEDVPLTKEDFDAQQAATIAAEKALNEKRDAFALIEATMRSYGFSEDELKELNTYIQAGLLNPKLGPEQLVLQLRQLPVYKARFAGNEERRARGLNALSEANYLLQESAYAETLRQYGLQRFVNRTQFATFIGNDISNTEVGRRVKTAVERLQMGDPAILRQLRSYYAITDSDIVSYFLNPKEVLPELEAKVTTAEIGATAGQYGLDTGLARASDLERYGVDLERARRGYSNIAQVLPRATTLSDIYKQAGIDYTQTTAEEEEFKGLASAKRAREKLVGLETAAFSGASGAARGVSLSKQLGGTY